MCRDDLGGPPDFHAAAFLQFAQQRPAVLRVQGTRRGGAPGGELVDAGPDGLGAGGIERLPRSVLRIDADKLFDRALQALEKRQIDVQTERGDVLSAGVLDADRRALGPNWLLPCWHWSATSPG